MSGEDFNSEFHAWQMGDEIRKIRELQERHLRASSNVQLEDIAQCFELFLNHIAKQQKSIELLQEKLILLAKHSTESGKNLDNWQEGCENKIIKHEAMLMLVGSVALGKEEYISAKKEIDGIYKKTAM